YQPRPHPMAGFTGWNHPTNNLAHGYARRQMSAFVELQEAEFAGYSDWSGYISPAMLASAATCQPLR
ncbi:MAG: hypothetical protein E6Q88_09710, partial [Lysobacteraceae bacterium]